MREPSVSDDDLAIAAAREKLGSLATRPGYEQAMQPEPRGSRRAAAIALVVAVALCALAVACGIYVDTWWLRWLLVLLFAVACLAAGLAALGMKPEAPPEAWPAIVTKKHMAGEHHHLVLQRDDGSLHDIMTLESVSAAVRAGDVGVAHVRLASRVANIRIVEAFHRL